jgi:prepilin-type N-terminal cleavage/methylation domain-containing protein
MAQNLLKPRLVHKELKPMRKDSGLTLMELLVAMAMVVVLANIGGPRFKDWLESYRLRNAARDLYSNMQLTKLGAIKANDDWAIIFDNSVTPGRYFVCSDDGGDGWDGPPLVGGNDSLVKEGRLQGYACGIDYGHGNATTNATFAGGAFPGDDIGYNANVLVFDFRGMCNTGYVYLQNNSSRPLPDRNTYAVGTRTSGVVFARKWFPASSSWGAAVGE